jgi:hypothetical protein
VYKMFANTCFNINDRFFYIPCTQMCTEWKCVQKCVDLWQNSLFCHKSTYLFTNIGKIVSENSEIAHTISGHSYTKEKSSGVDYWYLDEFLEEFICSRWYIYLEQTIYHLCRPISCWLSSLAVEYHLLWTIISYVSWYSSPADDIQLKQMILIWRGRYSSKTDDIHPMETIFIQDRRISSMMGDSWNYNQSLGMIINHWGYSKTCPQRNRWFQDKSSL